MQYIDRKMHSLREALVEDHMEREENRSCKKQKIRTLEKKHRTIRKNRG